MGLETGLFPALSTPSVFGRKITITHKGSEVRSNEQQSGLPSSNPKWAARSEKTNEEILCNYGNILFYWSKYLWKSYYCQGLQINTTWMPACHKELYVRCVMFQTSASFPPTCNRKLYIVHTEIERLNNSTLSEMNIFMYYEQHKLPGLSSCITSNRIADASCPLDQPFMVTNGTKKNLFHTVYCFRSGPT